MQIQTNLPRRARNFVNPTNVALVLLLLGACLHETFVDRQSGVRLMDRFTSYTSEAETMKAFHGVKVTTNVRSSLPAGDRRPKFDFVSLSVPYEHLGMAGELALQFFNDRLESVVFYPNDANEYLSRLRRSGVIVVDYSDTRRNPQVAVATDYRKRRYVTWIDVRLARQRDRWISRYA